MNFVNDLQPVKGNLPHMDLIDAQCLAGSKFVLKNKQIEALFFDMSVSEIREIRSNKEYNKIDTEIVTAKMLRNKNFTVGRGLYKLCLPCRMLHKITLFGLGIFGSDKSKRKYGLTSGNSDDKKV